ncbi:LacI family DNA-binding transcriptional regulator [Actinomadura rupiterrae]|uniref:LacI family DNA-binding transcriptional regulator n=1 Tax=Actinomadura rupiterrae TaxID=559627 RepID=UPI0020A2905F|nr:LacI family DNA-binding transcriptional regulator [Actinomadura rupiterrae]MCP2341740.1 DNA-binding LacI/PurR family transcriptional regulator [Actinomadura rupiterrae]
MTQDSRRTDHGPTIYEVAERAGVSIATVSRTLRGTGPVAPETRRRVLEAAEALRFTPSRAGVSLAEGRHAATGIVFPDLSGPYYAEVLMGCEEVASELGRSMIVLSTRGRSEVPRLVRDLAGRVDGLVVFGGTVPDDLLAELAGGGHPLVLIASAPLPGADLVAAENHDSAVRLAEHLVGHGHRTFTLLGAGDGSDIAQRWRGVTGVLERLGLPAGAPVPCAFTVEGGYAAGRELLARTGRPDAVVCADDQIALGVLLAAEELGLSVPADVAVTGWDDIMAARHARPALTTVRQPMRELGARAARALDELIGGERTGSRHQTLPTELVVRASCGTHPLEEA